jgi:hypothetical protein
MWQGRPGLQLGVDGLLALPLVLQVLLGGWLLLLIPLLLVPLLLVLQPVLLLIPLLLVLQPLLLLIPLLLVL